MKVSRDFFGKTVRGIIIDDCPEKTKDDVDSA